MASSSFLFFNGSSEFPTTSLSTYKNNKTTVLRLVWQDATGKSSKTLSINFLQVQNLKWKKIYLSSLLLFCTWCDSEELPSMNNFWNQQIFLSPTRARGEKDKRRYFTPEGRSSQSNRVSSDKLKSKVSKSKKWTNLNLGMCLKNAGWINLAQNEITC